MLVRIPPVIPNSHPVIVTRVIPRHCERPTTRVTLKLTSFFRILCEDTTRRKRRMRFFLSQPWISPLQPGLLLWSWHPAAGNAYNVCVRQFFCSAFSHRGRQPEIFQPLERRRNNMASIRIIFDVKLFLCSFDDRFLAKSILRKLLRAIWIYEWNVNS